MIYFRCSVGGSGKGNTVTVTCAEEFAGLPITLAKIGKTYTKTCPSTAPYVVTFYSVENGTYTVSCIVDGQTYSETVIVQDISCVLNYGFNWKLWVDTASQLDSSDYDSLDEVLADEKALRELFLEHACVDYMAEATSSNADLETIINDDYCAKWINNCDYALDFLGANTVIKALMDEADKYGYGEWVITDDTTTPPTWGAKGNVSIMTANTAPYGIASANSTLNSTYDAYKAFNGVLGTSNDGNRWVSAQGVTGTNARLIYKFANPIAAKRVVMQAVRSGNVSENPLASVLHVEASNDGTTWVSKLVQSMTAEEMATEQIYALENADYYLYYSIYFETYNAKGATDARYSQCAALQFYGRELKVSVPTMTSATAPYGEVSATNNQGNSSSAIWKPFDGNDTTYWWPANGTSNVRCSYKFTSPIKAKKIEVVFRNDNNKSKNITIKFQASHDGNVWVDITDNVTVLTDGSYRRYVYDLNSLDEPYEYYAFFTSSVMVIDMNATGLTTFQVWGLDYSEKEFEEGTTKKWLYDHGVEVTPITYANTGTNTVAENTGNEIFLNGGSGTAQASGAMAYAGKMDLTLYSRMRVKIGDILDGRLSSYKIYISLVISSLDTPSYNWNTSNVSLVDLRSDKAENYPNNVSLDITSVSGNNNPSILAYRSTDFYDRKGEIEEWWLE